jgi:hypothetical protein
MTTRYECGLFERQAIFILLLMLSSCAAQSTAPVESEPVVFPSSNADTTLIINAGYIEVDKVDRVSKFRSGIGHDSPDDFEQCRSMKHYFMMKDTVDWSKVKIYSPVQGTVVQLIEEWAGTQVQIQPTARPLFTIRIFHIVLQKALHVGDQLAEGQLLGTHIGSQTYSDIAIGCATPTGWRQRSYFALINDSLFSQYIARGAVSRLDFVIPKEARDADPLNCNGEAFGTEGTLENWVRLR